MKIRTGDKVQVMSGKEKDKGQISVVVKTFPDKNKILVKDVNVVTKHIKRQGTNPGQIVEMEKPIDVSNVMLICPFTEKPTRVGYVKIEEKGKIKKFRFSKKALKEKGGEASKYIIK
ncbi:50S ribosomal protein L24 [Candidatus Gracilibacteria bacterium HOT-871]|nr:50S ribosomal protein L24 [Candidatus Gracilibacteria bacterium HOT-871]MBB1565320.1 50S ribosomal protein L24 [Candidatus Gracilibacteria bacterium]RKW22301.1 MAG: 50S ribosomal protein L24 [Candidatus Gracilibacteria bacterium]